MSKVALDSSVYQLFSTLSSVWTNITEGFSNIWDDILSWFETNIPNVLLTIIIILLLLLLTIIVERFSTALIKRTGKRLDWADGLINGFAFFIRLFVIILGIGLISAVGGIPGEWTLTITAIISAAIGLSSTRTVGNIISGLSVLMSRPFGIGDYVRIGTTEGIVQEIKVTYTKLISRDEQTIFLTNQEVSNAKIIVYATDEISNSYNLCATFDHSIPHKDMCKMFEKVINRFTPDKIPDIFYEVVEITRLERKYRFSFVFDYVEDYNLFPSIFLDELLKEYDKLKAKLKRKAAKRATKS